MQIQHEDGERRGLFYVEENGERVAEIVYTNGGGGTITIEHTEVGAALKGQHVGFKLVEKVVEYARGHGLKIVPVCPFAKAMFDKRADFRDVLA